MTDKKISALKTPVECDDGWYDLINEHFAQSNK